MSGNFYPSPQFINVSAAIDNSILQRAFGRSARSRILTVLYEYASGPHGSARRSREAVKRFHETLSWLMGAKLCHTFQIIDELHL
jgi:hypothetical protein